MEQELEISRALSNQCSLTSGEDHASGALSLANMFDPAGGAMKDFTDVAGGVDDAAGGPWSGMLGGSDGTGASSSSILGGIASRHAEPAHDG